MKLYDTNGDGYLDEKELERCPALKNSLASMDLDGDHKLSAAEIEGRLRSYQNARIGIMTVACNITLDNRPLDGATVRLIPEPFMGTSIQPASGVSRNKGHVELRIEGAEFPGVHCGFYKVEVSLKDPSGKETLPARYNAQTTLGSDVAPNMRDGIHLDLRTK